MFDDRPLTLEFYQTAAGAEPLSEWLNRLKDQTATARIRARLTRLQTGNPGDYKAVGQGLSELRVDCGPGYRIYFAFAGDRLILLLCGGAKNSQQKDIAAAQRFWDDYCKRYQQ